LTDSATREKTAGATHRHHQAENFPAIARRDRNDPCTAKARLPTHDRLLTDAQRTDDIQITLGIVATDIIKQSTAAADQTQQTTSRSIIASVGSHVFCQPVDSLCQNGNLDLWRPSICVVVSVFRNHGGFAFFRNRHQVLASELINEFSSQVYRSRRSLQLQN
jgi:hypothetical protein